MHVSDHEDRDGSATRARPGPARIGSVNLRDVAKRAGVSPATASRVFAGAKGVQASTRERVLSAADELGYVVNGLARSMTGRGLRTMAFVVREMIGPTFAALAAGVESRATPNGYLLMICTTHGARARARELVKTLREQRTAAVLLVGSTENDDAFAETALEYARSLADIDAPLVFCGRPPLTGHDEIPSADYDQGGGVRSVVDHLVSLGHRRIAYVGGAPGMTTPDLRLSGYRDGLAAHGLEFDPRLVLETTNYEDPAEAAVGKLLQSGVTATALVCMTDVIAIGAMRALRAARISIPDMMSVVGFDDVPMVGDLTPALTTVHPPFYEVGVAAAEIALSPEHAGHVLLEPRLVVRGSTGAPPLS